MSTESIKAGPLLSAIHTPEDLRKLKPEQLQQVCDELRDYIIDTEIGRASCRKECRARGLPCHWKKKMNDNDNQRTACSKQTKRTGEQQRGYNRDHRSNRS